RGPQRSSDCSNSSAFSGESEPAKSDPPARKVLRPPPEPIGSYSTVTPGSTSAKPAFQPSIAAAWDEAPAPTSVPASPGAVEPVPPPAVPHATASRATIAIRGILLVGIPLDSLGEVREATYETRLTARPAESERRVNFTKELVEAEAAEEEVADVVGNLFTGGDSVDQETRTGHERVADEASRDVGWHRPQQPGADASHVEIGELCGEAGVGLPDPLLGVGAHPAHVTMEDRAENAVVGDELARLHREHGETLHRWQVPGDRVDEVLDHIGQLGLDQRRDQVVPVGEVL